MEQIFSPCTRYRDIVERQGRDFPPWWLRELDLNVSTDEFLSAERGFTYADLYAMMANGDTNIWLTPHAAIVSTDRIGTLYWNDYYNEYHIRFTVDGREMAAWAHSSEAIIEICDIVIRLVAASIVHSVILCKWHSPPGASINAATLAYLMEQCQSLKGLTLMYLALNEDHCRVLGSHSWPDLEINLEYCVITDAGTRTLAEVLGRNQGPTRLYLCANDIFLLANGLRGNSRLKSFSTYFRERLAIAEAVRENKGLIELCLQTTDMSNEAWSAICDSLKTHPTLEVLDLSAILRDFDEAPAVTTSRVQALLGMMEVNTSILTIHLRNQYSEHELFQRSVVPYLKTNQFRLHVRAILPSLYRDKVLGRALLAVRTDPNRFWMLLSGNAEVAFPATTATTTLLAILPTPAIVATASNTADASTDVATATATATATISRPASSSGASTIDSSPALTAR
jgi:hypothetical protein